MMEANSFFPIRLVNAPSVELPCEDGHMSRECTGPQKEKTCYRCNQPGHLSRDCNDPNAVQTGGNGGYGASAGGAECYKCGKVGHIARHRPVILAAATVTCLATVPRDRSATTAARSVTCRANALASRTVSATSASSPVT
ncbi:hypothetical protein BZA05DRAFT_42337 [Tricharina praecox]|uniref:uncharacterized protein n=1 Tax=Tricharina praecox TaxID=43433 RepID=UPI0022209156|nr:uncharacterized protein BZA05DRAFT_42337 [Tricharina praecox]KAI5852351.1 hypothetical protein BZA05DRAFT_42337 [Tricharina praecox]